MRLQNFRNVTSCEEHSIICRAPRLRKRGQTLPQVVCSHFAFYCRNEYIYVIRNCCNLLSLTRNIREIFAWYKLFILPLPCLICEAQLTVYSQYVATIASISMYLMFKMTWNSLWEISNKVNFILANIRNISNFLS